MKTLIIIIVRKAIILLAIFFIIPNNSNSENINHNSEIGVGALGRIVPQAGIISLSHDAGFDGVKILNINVKEGQQIKKGYLIAEFSSIDRNNASLSLIKSKKNVLMAKLNQSLAELDYMQKEFSRNKDLFEKKFISESNYESHEKLYRQAIFSIDVIKSELKNIDSEIKVSENELKRSRLLSPIDGTVLKLNYLPGESFYQKGLIEIANLDKIDVEAEVNEQDILRVQIGKSSGIYINNLNNSYKGIVCKISQLADKSTLLNYDPTSYTDNRIFKVKLCLDEKTTKAFSNFINMQVNVRIDWELFYYSLLHSDLHGGNWLKKNLNY